MTAKRQIHVRSIVVIALAYLVGAVAYPFLPAVFLGERPVLHVLTAFLLPTTALVIYSLFRSLWQHDRVRTGNGAFEATYQSIVLRAVLFVFALHVIVMLLLTDAMDAIGIRSWGGRTVIVMLGLTIAAIGNLLPRTRPNVAFGVRTPKTLTSVPLWQQVHRVGGYATVALGVVTAITGAMVTPKVGMGTVVLGAVFTSTIIFVSYRKYANA